MYDIVGGAIVVEANLAALYELDQRIKLISSHTHRVK